MATTFLVLATIAASGLALAASLWPAADEQPAAHVHRDLPPDHPHLADAEPLPSGGFRHAHSPADDALHATRGG